MCSTPKNTPNLTPHTHEWQFVQKLCSFPNSQFFGTPCSYFTFSFMGVYNSLPETGYIKMVEIWMIFTMSYPFLVILLQCSLEVSINVSHVENLLQSNFSRS